MNKRIGAALVAATALTVIASPAHANVARDVIRGPITCNPVRCVQQRTVILRDGQSSLTKIQVRHAAGESREMHLRALPWTRWKTVSTN